MGSAFAWYLLSFRGRISRQEFWLGYAGAVILILLVGRSLEGVSLYLLRPAGRPWFRDELDLAIQLPMLLVAGMLIWPMISIYAKRLHDMNVSAWWLLVLPAITIAAELTSLDGWHLATWAQVLVLGFLPGSRGSNRFGADPVARAVV
jgi:uncharacterized membrane protein YhaH (DUF805 family)